MAELTVDLTYGTALMEAARDIGKEQQILDEALTVVQLLKDEPDLHKFIPRATSASLPSLSGTMMETMPAPISERVTLAPLELVSV